MGVSTVMDPTENIIRQMRMKQGGAKSGRAWIGMDGLISQWGEVYSSNASQKEQARKACGCDSITPANITDTLTDRGRS